MKVEWCNIKTAIPTHGQIVLGVVSLPDDWGGGRIIANVQFVGNEFLGEFLWQGRFSVAVSHWAEPVEMPEEIWSQEEVEL